MSTSYGGIVREGPGYRVEQTYTPPGGVGNVEFQVIRMSDTAILGEFFPTGRGQEMSVFVYEHPSLRYRSYVGPLPVVSRMDMAITMCIKDMDRE